MPIDRFLRSLADQCGSRAIGVILSGAGTDGSAGVEAIKAAGGVTFAQDPATAKFASMPQAAVATGCVDFVLPPEGIAAELVRIGRHPYMADALRARQERTLSRRRRAVRQHPGHSARGYRHRLFAVPGEDDQAPHPAAPRTAQYQQARGVQRAVEDDSDELSALQRDLLISVTSFFRDPESFESLKKVVFPRILQGRSAKRHDSHLGGGLRHWRRGLLDRHLAAGIPERNRRRLSGADLRFRYQRAGN